MHSFFEGTHATWLPSALIYVLQYATCLQMLQGGQQSWRTGPLTGLLMPAGLYYVPQRLWHVSASHHIQLADHTLRLTEGQ